jgi:hypothetical protein
MTGLAIIGSMTDYEARVAAALRTFADQEVVHDLPAIRSPGVGFSSGLGCR